MKIKKYIEENLLESSRVKKETFKKCWPEIAEASRAVAEVYFKKGGTVFLFGNGGSAADSQHIAGELFSMFHLHRIPLSANALTTDTSVLTSISNDMGYEYIFSRQLEALATSKDLVMALSTSGNSPNVINGIKLAKSRGIKTIGLTGQDGGELAKLADIVIKVPAKDVARVQEVHTTIGHIICGIVEEELFGKEGFNE